MAALMPRLFGDVTEWFESDFPLRTGHMIRVEDFMTEEEYLLRAELPGMDPDKDVRVTINDSILTISAERQEQQQTRTRTEFRYGALQRSIRLPRNADVEHVTAKYGKGILEVKVPLTAAEPVGKQIPVAKDE
jgi:HSP20 family molecular chaperone IbpA